jgi:succinate dehydrogenase flavin-adding protein (antitoxin of CptAB toxin-antitoxin module)
MADVQDILDNLNVNDIPEDNHLKEKKKKVNGCRKGKAAERDICHELEALFPGDIFRRVPMSGAFMGGFNFNKNMKINEEAKKTLTGDIITPTWMKFSLESKAYDDDPQFHKILNGEDKMLDKWIGQATEDAAKVDKKMLIIFRITSKRSGYVCLERQSFIDFVEHRNPTLPETALVYKGKYIILEKSVFMDNYFKLYKSVEDWFYTKPK